MLRSTLFLAELAAVFLVGLGPPASAQIVPGRVYRGGEMIADPESGLRLTLPAGWSGQLSAGGESLHLRPDSGAGDIVVIADAFSEAEARAQLAQPLDLGAGVRLTPEGDIREVASGHLSARYAVAGTPEPRVGTVDVRITQAGLGVAFVLLSPPQAADTQRAVMREFAFSLGVMSTAARKAAAEAGDAWEPYLKGKYLARYFTRSGYTESTELWLCSDGSFAYRSEGGGFGGGASGAVLASGGGRWTAAGAGKSGTLTLTWYNGERSTLELSYDYERDRLYLEGDRMLRGHNERCR